MNPKFDWIVGRSLPFNHRSIGDRPPDAPGSPRGSEGGVLGTNRSQSEDVVPPGTFIEPSVLAGTPRTPSNRSENRGVGRGTTATWSTTREARAKGQRTGPLQSQPRYQVYTSALLSFRRIRRTEEKDGNHVATRTALPGVDGHRSRQIYGSSCVTSRRSCITQTSPSQMTSRGENRAINLDNWVR